MDIVLWVLVAIVLYGIYKYVTINNDYFEKRGVAFAKPTFLVGNMASLMFRTETMLQFTSYIYQVHPGKKILGMFDMRTPFYVPRDPEVVKQLTVKDFDHFEDHRPFLDVQIDAMFGNSLISLTGTKWRDMRATLSPAFTGSKMRQMFELVAECAEEMSLTFKKQAQQTGSIEWEMKELYSKYANDVISSTAFGYKINSFEDPDNDFYLAGKKIMDFNSTKAGIKMIIISMMPKLVKMFGMTFTDVKVTNFFRQMVLGNMESREKQGIFRPDMINILMNVKKGTANSANSPTEDTNSDGFATVEESNVGSRAVKRDWTDDELVAQCFLFFLAGFDTTSTLLTFLSHEITINPDIQQKLYNEIQETHENLGGKGVTYDALGKMKYMDMVISETLRYWPPAPIVDRICVKDYNYDDGQSKFKIDKGTTIFIPIYGFHHDEKHWPNPKVFDPERFSDENKDKITPGTYLPFSMGPRNCIGSRFALMQAKAVLYYLLLNFSLEPNAKTEIPLKISKSPFSLTTEGGVILTLKLRK